MDRGAVLASFHPSEVIWKRLELHSASINALPDSHKPLATEYLSLHADNTCEGFTSQDVSVQLSGHEIQNMNESKIFIC